MCIRDSRWTMLRSSTQWVRNEEDWAVALAVDNTDLLLYQFLCRFPPPRAGTRCPRDEADLPEPGPEGSHSCYQRPPTTQTGPPCRGDRRVAESHAVPSCF